MRCWVDSGLEWDMGVFSAGSRPTGVMARPITIQLEPGRQSASSITGTGAAKLSSTRESLPRGGSPTLKCGEKAVVREGWKLYGPVQSSGTTIVFTALAGFDWMCRPLGYQAFAYSEERYAGTLSPVPMNSRTDGSLTRVPLDSEHRRVCPLSRFRPTLLSVKDEHSRIPGPKR